MEGDHVWLRVSAVKGVMRFGKKGKLSPRFIGPFDILSRVGEVAHKLALPPSLSAIHPVFHVSIFGSIFRMNLMCFHLNPWSWVQT